MDAKLRVILKPQLCGHMSKSSYWCITNYEDYDLFIQKLKHLYDSGIISYCIVGKEVCPTTGRKHNQSYIEFHGRKRFSQVVNCIGGSSHIEARKGSANANRDYCSKEGSYQEWGDISKPAQGRRTDLEALQKSLQEGKSILEISESHFGEFLRYGKMIREYYNLHSVPRTWKTICWVLYGKTGTGKTKYVYDKFPTNEIYSHPGGMWFDGYHGQEICIFDDFGGSEFKLTYLLKLLDRYPMKVPVKGSFVNWCPKEIYITSNHHPTEWYPNAKEEHVKALMRRIDELEEFN